MSRMTSAAGLIQYIAVVHRLLAEATNTPNICIPQLLRSVLASAFDKAEPYSASSSCLPFVTMALTIFRRCLF